MSATTVDANEKRAIRSAFETSIKLAIHKVAGMTATMEDTGDGALTKSPFCRGIESAQLAIAYGLRLGAADPASLTIALDARGAFDLLSSMLSSLDPEEFVGEALAATRDEMSVIMTALRTKHPSVLAASAIGMPR